MARHDAAVYAVIMALNVRIRELRQGKGWTLEQLASMAGLSIPYLSQIERGIKNLNNHQIERISGALGVSPAELIGSYDVREQELAGILADLSDADKDRVRQFALALRASSAGDTPSK